MSEIATVAANRLLRVAETVGIGSGRVPLLGSSNIWIEDSIAGSASIRLVQTIMQEALRGTAPGQLELIVFDDALSGLASPFAPLNEGGERLLNVVHDEQDFKATLRYLRDHVQEVNRKTRGESPSLVDFRYKAGYPVEGYKLVVVSTDVSFLDDASQIQLSILLNAGPAAGVSFLIHSMTLGANKQLVLMCDYLKVKPPGVIERDGADPIWDWTPPKPPHLIKTADETAKYLAATKATSIPFAEVQALDAHWRRTSTNGLTFAMGLDGDRILEVTLGDELNQRHNMLVTGAVGQGKSNFLSVMIHSLCQRYAPQELELYLLDFKEGVSLQPFFDEITGQYLPHARVLGLDADQEFGQSVLRHLHELYRARMKAFKAADVQNLQQYREEYPDRPMPRVVVVIDEFQMMFAERDRASDEIAALLVRGVRLFRASGIHIVLASQTIGGNTSLMGSAGEGLFAQVPIRVALKNSVTESRATLGDRNDAASRLRAREAIVNLEYGEITANMKAVIAHANEQVLRSLRAYWWREAKGTTSAPYVFLGERRRSLAADADRLRALRASRRPSLLLGARIEVDGRPLEVSFRREIGRNAAVIGSGDAVPVVQSMAISLAAQVPRTRFAVLDLLEDSPSWNESRQTFVRVMSKLGADVEMVSKADTPGFIQELASTLDDRQETADLVIVGLGLDRCRPMPLEFQDVIKIGSPVGVHVIGWWLKLDSFREHVGYGGEAYVDTRLALRLDPQSAKQFMADPLLDWRAPDNRMLVWDSTELPEATRVIPYTVIDDALDLAEGLTE